MRQRCIGKACGKNEFRMHLCRGCRTIWTSNAFDVLFVNRWCPACIADMPTVKWSAA